MSNFKNELNNYQNIPRKLIFDSTMSDRARFVYCYMASKPDDWDFYLTPMAKEIGYSIDTLRKYINELVEHGWLEKGEQDKLEGNLFGSVPYTLKAEPANFSDTDFFRHGEMPTQHKRDNNRNDINYKKEKEEINNNSAIELNWKNNFDEYKKIVIEAMNVLISDLNNKAYIEKYYPNADYEKSVQKLVDSFWGIEEGWEWCKKRRKGKTINMVSALKKNLDRRDKIVYKQTSHSSYGKSAKPQGDSNVKSSLNPSLRIIDSEGTLSDGTFYKRGFRYYYSRISRGAASIPLDAPEKPNGDNFEYDIKLGWYECE